MTSFITKKSSNKSLTTPLIALSLFFMLFGLSPRVLYATPRGEGMLIMRDPSFRKPSSDENKIRVVGELTSSTDSNGERYLNLKENQTGKTYRLIGQDEAAKQFFKNGTTRVAVEGTVSDDSKLNVQTTEAF